MRTGLSLLRSVLMFATVLAAPAFAAAAEAGELRERTIAQFSSVTVDGGGPRVTGSGKEASEVRALAPFSSVVVRGPVDVQLKAGDAERVTLRADDNILRLIETRVAAGKLEIGTQAGASFRTGHRIAAVVEFKALNGITLVGSGDVRVDKLKSAIFEAVIRGSGDVTIGELEVDALALSITGSGNFRAAGRANTVGIVIEGSGDARVADLQARRGAVKISGSGDVTINAAEQLEVEIGGSGDVRYRGAPRINRKVTGTGEVSPLR